MTARPRARRISRWTTRLVAVLVVAGCAGWVVPSALGYSRYVVTDRAMTGTYDKGSIVLGKPVPVEDLRSGDVITYLPPADTGVAEPVTRRIVTRERAAGGDVLLTTQGDSAPAPDPWRFTLIGTRQPVVQHAVPYVGWVPLALAHGPLRMLLVGGPAAVVGLMALAEIARALRGRRDRRRTSAPVPTLAAGMPPQRVPADEVRLTDA